MIDERPIFFTVLVDSKEITNDGEGLSVVMSKTKDDAVSLAKLKTVDGTVAALIYRGVEVGAFEDGMEEKQEAVRGS